MKKNLGFSIVIIFMMMISSCAGTRPAESLHDAGETAADTEKIKVILDCDNSMGSFFWEVDDGLVIAYLLNQPNAELLGITTTFGNRTYDHKYTVRQLKEAGRTDIPLFKGAQGPDEDPTEAARFLAETAARYPGEVTIIAAGPTANLEAAAQIDPDFFSNLKQIAAMGGRTGDFSLGKRPVKELNLSADFEATYKMLHSGCPITIMTSQFCVQAPFSREDLKRLTHFPSKWKGYLSNWLFTHRLGLGLNHFILWDLVPTVYVFHPEYFQDNRVTIRSEKEDLKTGYLKTAENGEGPVVNLPEQFIDRDAFFRDLFAAWNRQGKRIY